MFVNVALSTSLSYSSLHLSAFQILPLEPVLLPLTVASLLCIYLSPVAEDHALPLTWFLFRRASVHARERRRIWVRPLASVRQPSAAWIYHYTPKVFTTPHSYGDSLPTVLLPTTQHQISLPRRPFTTQPPLQYHRARAILLPSLLSTTSTTSPPITTPTTPTPTTQHPTRAPTPRARRLRSTIPALGRAARRNQRSFRTLRSGQGQAHRLPRAESSHESAWVRGAEE